LGAFLKEKSKVFDVFQRFKLMFENEVGCKIKNLRYDNGTEYTTGDFKKLFEKV